MSQQIPNLLKKRAYLTPKRTAIIFAEQSYTFQDLYNNTVKMSYILSRHAIAKGDYVGVLLRNHLDTVTILYALQMLGATAVILNNRLTNNELAWQLNDSKCTALITERAFASTVEALTTYQADYSIFSKEQLFAMQANTEDGAKVLEEFDLDDVCTVMYTSGTTGFPKGVMQTYGNHWWSAIGSALNLGLLDTDRWLCTVPLFHISGYSILIRSLVYGMPIVLHDGFNEQKVLEDIEKHKVTIMSVVATMLTRIVRELGDKKIPAHFRCMLLGGGPASLTLLQDCKSKGIPVFQTYGMTETASQIVTLSPEDSLNKIGSAGKPLFPAQLKIVNSDQVELRPKEEGEIIVKGPNVTQGYLYREEETRAKIRDGWLHTGDIGYLDDEGFLYVLDRRSDLIISGGENIYPAEIEGVLQAHLEVEEAGVIGIDDEKWGQVPMAFVVKKQTSKLSHEELIRHCQQKLAKYKVPRKIIFVKELPRNAANKLLRKNLRELFNGGMVDDEL